MQIGDIVDFRFTLTAHLGSGGMGKTFRAKDADTGDTVVVKTLREDLIASMDSLSEDRLRSRFRREATLLGAISHPHIPATFRVRPEGVWPYIAMQLIEGKSLGGYLAGNRQPGPAEVASLGLQALEALDATHGDQVLHRDLKPDNIMITNSGWVFLIDFGIALPLADGTTRYTNDWVGTIGYMAPERLNGGSESAASDMYSWGAFFSTK